ncbi:MAG: DUF6531 domain-containing protein [Kiritimatiellae bacterium]|nr:DUF6531 domain-containing protein [Kiritimatiellia bacterium]
MYGAGGFGSLFNGWLGGGEPSRPGVTSADKVLRGNARVLNEGGTVASTRSADPVDMRSGAAVIDRSDLAIKGATPLRWRRHYDSRQRYSNNASGRGCSHGYDSRITVHTDPDAFIGRDMPASAAASIVACTVVSDLVLTNTAKTLTTACLVTKWWTDQLLNNAATITADGSALSFCRLPDGSYEPQPGVTATFTGSASSGFSLQERFGDIWRFTTNGVLASVEDRSGNRVSLSYTNGTSLVSVANDFGAQLNIDWSGDKITSVSDNAGRSLAYAYSPAGCLTSVTDVAGYTWAMDYNDEGNLLSETDPEGIVTVQNTYNALGQVTNQLSASGQRWQFAFADGWRSWEADPLHNQVNYGFTPGGRNSWREDRDGAYHQFFYDFFGHMVTNIDAVGREHVSVYDNDNHLLSVTEAANAPDARATSFAYNDGHHLIAITNALGRVTRMSYDNCDRLALLTTPDGVSVTNTYTAEGLLAASRALAPNGGTLRESSFVYNARGLPEAITATDAGTTTFSYDSAGNVTGIIDARSNPATITYDPRGFATNAVNALGHSAFTLFSAAGRPLASTDPLGRTTAFQWTPGGNPAATIFADGAAFTNHYDAADRLVSVTDPRDATLTFNLDVAGRATNRVAATWSDCIWYDAAGVVTTRQDTVSGRTDIASDWLDRPVAVTDPLSHTRHAYYDPLNAVTNTVDPRGRATRHTYDVMGRLIRTTRLDGADNSSVYEYDALNRNTSVTYADDTTETFAYDAVGNLTAADNGVISNSFTYDTMNRLVGSEVRDQTSEVSFQTSYRYDIGGLITNIVYPGNKTLHYVYDTDGRLVSVTDWNSRTFTFTHDAAGRRTSLTYPNGVSGTYTYDATHHLTSWQYAKGGSTLTGRAITRDAVGLKTGESVTAGRFPNPTQPRRMQNTFDAADRLTAAVVHSGTNTFNEIYRYNANGVLTNRVCLQSTVVSHHSAYTYDLAGRFSGYNSQFPIHNSQFSVCYDALGNRTKTVQDGTTRLWVTDHADPLKRPLMETDADGEPVRYYIWGGGTLLDEVLTLRVCMLLHINLLDGKRG